MKRVNGRLATFLEQEIRRICEANTWTIGALNVQEDHVHLFLSAPPSVSLSQIAHTLKGTTRKVFQRFPEVKKHLWGGAFWSRSYYVGSVGDMSVDTVLKYWDSIEAEKEKRCKCLSTVDLFHDASESLRNLIDGYDRNVSIGRLSINHLVYIHGLFRGGLRVLGQSARQ